MHAWHEERPSGGRGINVIAECATDVEEEASDYWEAITICNTAAHRYTAAPEINYVNNYRLDEGRILFIALSVALDLVLMLNFRTVITRLPAEDRWSLFL
jgi:hypothetical protein